MSPFFESKGETEYNPTISKIDIKEKEVEPIKEQAKQEQEENLELREMLLSNKKKKILQRVREERVKNSRQIKK